MQFNIRVYGILLDRDKRVLVSDEFIRGQFFTKFPGGGLEFGEGTRDCLKREFKEETGLDVLVGGHIYTTDFFQISAFEPTHQIISVYYFVHAENLDSLAVKEKRFDFLPQQLADKTAQLEVFRWVPWDGFNETQFDLPIDKVVVNLITK